MWENRQKQFLQIMINVCMLYHRMSSTRFYIDLGHLATSKLNISLQNHIAILPTSSLSLLMTSQLHIQLFVTDVSNGNHNQFCKDIWSICCTGRISLWNRDQLMQYTSWIRSLSWRKSLLFPGLSYRAFIGGIKPITSGFSRPNNTFNYTTITTTITLQ